MFLLSGMHFSIATHICGGEIAQVKWSFSDEKASCGMESDNETCPTDKSFSQECCHDQIVFCTVDNNYNPSTLQIKEPVNQLLQIFYIPETIGFQSFNTKYASNANVQPSDKFLVCAVSLPDICVFRI